MVEMVRAFLFHASLETNGLCLFTNLEVQIYDSNSAGSLSSYNTRLNHDAIAIGRGGSNTATTTEGTITHALNVAGTELTITLPVAPFERVLGVMMGYDGSGSTKTLTWKTDLGSATLASNTVKLEPYDGTSAFDMTTISNGVQIAVVMVRRKLMEQNP